MAPRTSEFEALTELERLVHACSRAAYVKDGIHGAQGDAHAFDEAIRRVDEEYEGESESWKRQTSENSLIASLTDKMLAIEPFSLVAKQAVGRFIHTHLRYHSFVDGDSGRELIDDEIKEATCIIRGACTIECKSRDDSVIIHRSYAANSDGVWQLRAQTRFEHQFRRNPKLICVIFPTAKQ